jgi:hypothetical protein
VTIGFRRHPPIIAAPTKAGSTGAKRLSDLDVDKHPVILGYFAAIRGRDIEALLRLFAEDAEMILPDGRELGGKDSLRTMYTHLFAADPPLPAPTAAIVAADGLATEIESKLPDGSARQTANFFHLDDGGLIRRLSVYKRG